MMPHQRINEGRRFSQSCLHISLLIQCLAKLTREVVEGLLRQRVCLDTEGDFLHGASPSQ
jgi:hypothetical protein